MNQDGFSIPHSMLETVRSLCEALSLSENLVFLSGDSGSGRTSLCEHVVSSLENRFSTVFLPCQSQLSLEQLRLLFLQQLAPEGAWDCTLPLFQSFSQISIPVRQKILVVADDIDSVDNTFYEDLISLYEHYLGKNRFSILLTAHPLWTQSKLGRFSNTAVAASEISVRALSLDEAVSLAGQMFVFSDLSNVYKAIEPKLPALLEQCNGNITRIIKLTEAIMADPAKVDSKNQETAFEGASSAPAKKRSGTSSVFITIICIIIVLACLVPVFLGSSVIDKILGRDPAAQEGVVNTQIDLNETDRLTFGEDETVVQKSPSEDADQSSQSSESKDSQSKNDSSPLAVSSGASADISANGPKGDENVVIEDDGALPEQVSGGVEADDAKDTTKNSVTIAGDDLKKIEGAESDSDGPRRGLGGSVDNKAKSEEPKPQIVVLTRADNSLHTDEVERERAEFEGEKKLISESEDYQREQRILRETAQREAEAEAQRQADLARKAEREAKELADRLSLEQNAKPKAENQSLAQAPKEDKKTQQNESSNKSAPVPGSVSELDEKSSSHYTLQLQAGRKRASLVEASAGVNGRYWIYETTREGRPWYVLITGDYATAKQATDMIRTLPSHLRRNGPFAKSFGKVKSEMRLR